MTDLVEVRLILILFWVSLQRKIPKTVDRVVDKREGINMSKGEIELKLCLREITVVGKICKLVEAKTSSIHAPS